MADQTQAYPVVQCSAILSLVFTLWIHHTYIFIHNNILSLIICRQAVPGADQTSSQYDAGMHSECYSEPTKSPLMCIDTLSAYYYAQWGAQQQQQNTAAWQQYWYAGIRTIFILNQSL